MDRTQFAEKEDPIAALNRICQSLEQYGEYRRLTEQKRENLQIIQLEIDNKTAMARIKSLEHATHNLSLIIAFTFVSGIICFFIALFA